MNSGTLHEGGVNPVIRLRETQDTPEVTIKGAIGVTSTGYANAIRLLESRKYPVERMHTHDFDLREAELAIKTLAREIPDDESIHSCLIPEQ